MGKHLLALFLNRRLRASVHQTAKKKAKKMSVTRHTEVQAITFTISTPRSPF